MANTQNDNADWGRIVESAACERWPAQRVSDRVDGHDLVFEGVASGDTPSEVVTAGDVAECKAVCLAVSDGNSTRAEHWWFRRESHDCLVEADGVYIAGVYIESEGVLRMAFIPAQEMNRVLSDHWTSCGTSHSADESVQPPWTAIFRRERVTPSDDDNVNGVTEGF